MTALKAAITTYPHTVAWKQGHVRAEADVDFVAMPPTLTELWRNMARHLAYDFSEMGITTALGAKELGVPFTPIPVFLTRRFDHEAMYFNVDSGIASPKDLEGKRVATRSPMVTDVIWSCGILLDKYGVDLDKIHWVVTGDDHIVETPLPPNSERRPAESVTASLDALVESGEVDALMGRYTGSAANVRPFFADVRRAEREWLEEYGWYPLHHTVVIRSSVLEANPEVASDLYRAFCAAKALFLERLASGVDVLAEDESPNGPLHDYGFDDVAALRRPDPIPYGIEANRAALESLLRYAHAQHLSSRLWRPEEVFAPVGE